MFSIDDTASEPRRFLIPVDATLKSLLSREDTDQNVQITIDDAGPKVLSLGTESSHGFKHFDIRGNYSMIPQVASTRPETCLMASLSLKLSDC